MQFQKNLYEIFWPRDWGRKDGVWFLPLVEDEQFLKVYLSNHLPRYSSC